MRGLLKGEHRGRSLTVKRLGPGGYSLTVSAGVDGSIHEGRPDLVPWRICPFAHQPRAKCYSSNKEGDTHHPDYSNNGTLPSDDADD